MNSYSSNGNPAEPILDSSEERLRKTELELKQRTAELARSRKEIEQFAYIASHDLQEPLRTISSYLQLLQNRYSNTLDIDANDFINFAIDGSNRMRNLLSSLLEYSRISRNKPFELTSCNKIIEEVSQQMNGLIQETKTTIHCEEFPILKIDAVLISELFHHLIGNAIKFRSAQPPEIKISLQKTEGFYVFSIADNGIGIDPKFSGKIFEIFQRLHPVDKYPGAGMGLPICKKIVERHGGEIWVKSEVGKGSTFYFSISKTLKKNEIN